METFEKGLTPWTDFAEQCIIGAYGDDNAESIVNKKMPVGDGARTITKAEQLGRLLAKGNLQKITRKEVFTLMDDLRKQPT